MVERPNPRIEPDLVVDPLKLKIVMVGESGVGKTCLIKRFDFNTYNASEEKTVGSDFFSKTLKCTKGIV